MKYNIKVTKDNVYKIILNIINFSLKLTPLELDILQIILENNINIIDTNARELIRKVLNKDKFITNNYIIKLKNKNILLADSKKLYLNPGINDIVKSKSITFNFDESL